MQQRGRKSAASLLVIRGQGGARPEPPEKLSKTEADIWRAVVATKPADWFGDDNLPLLADYCRHIVRQDRISRIINQFDEEDSEDPIKDLDKLLKMSERESRIITTLATKMRLSQQSRYTEKSAATAAKKGGQSGVPWQFGSD